MEEPLEKFRLFPSVSGTIRPTLWSINLQLNTVKTSVYIKNFLGWSWIGNCYLLPWYLISAPRKFPSKPATKWNISSWWLTWYFVCWNFTIVTVGSAHIPYFVWFRDCWKQLRCIPNIQRLAKEDSIIWFDLCGWLQTILGDFWVGLITNRNPVLGITDYWYCCQLFLCCRLELLIQDKVRQFLI